MPRGIPASSGAAFVLLAFNLLASPSQGQPTYLDLRVYRTPISPGELHEDAVFLREVVEFLAKDVVLAPTLPRGDEGYESFDVRVDRNKTTEADGSVKFDQAGRPVFSVTPTIQIKGENYKILTRAYLEWRKAFELEWLASARGATEELKPTPLKMIFDHPTLPRFEKVRETVQFYRLKTLPRIPKPTPNPAFWPVSPIMDLPDYGVQVQFNLRGGQVTVLDSESSKVWVLPFPSEVDPNRWMEEYKREVRKGGKEKAAEILRQEALRWGLPVEPKPGPIPTTPPPQKASGEAVKE